MLSETRQQQTVSWHTNKSLPLCLIAGWGTPLGQRPCATVYEWSWTPPRTWRALWPSFPSRLPHRHWSYSRRRGRAKLESCWCRRPLEAGGSPWYGESRAGSHVSLSATALLWRPTRRIVPRARKPRSAWAVHDDGSRIGVTRQDDLRCGQSFLAPALGLGKEVVQLDGVRRHPQTWTTCRTWSVSQHKASDYVA